MSQSTGSGRLPDVIFLVGSAHTGKTEVAAAFRKQAGTAVVRRAYFWRNEYDRCRSLRSAEHLDKCVRRLARDEFLRSAGVGPEHLAHLAESTNGTSGGLFLTATGEAARRLAGLSEVPDRLVVQIGGLERLATAISEDLPEARFVHTIRDPRAYFSTPESGYRMGQLGWRLASWDSSATAALRNLEEIPDRYLVVRGEDLIDAHGRVASLISSRVGGDVNLDEARRSLTAKGGSLSKRRAQIVERLVGHQLEAFGYPIDRAGGRGARSVTAVDAGMYHLRNRLALRSGATS